MIKKIMILIVLVGFRGLSQDLELRATAAIESEIFYNDGSSEKGMLWLASSPFSPRIKNEHKNSSRKIDYKNIDKIITNPNSDNQRVFQYLNHNYNKYKIFVELRYKDSISIYQASKNNGSDLFYSNYDRESTREKLSKMNSENFMGNPNINSTRDGKNIITAYSNSTALWYYILKQGNPILMRVENNKRFLKKSKEYFKNCPELIDDLENNKITLDNLTDFYRIL